MLLDQCVELAVLQHLTEAVDCETQNGNGGAQVEGLLKCPCRAHFVVTQTNAKTPAFAAAATVSTTALAVAAAVSLSPLLLGIAVGITHGPWPGIRRKCDASPGWFP